MTVAPNYTYPAELVRVVDGDTVRLKVSMGFYTYTEQNFRLLDINTPEIRGEERPDGLVAKQYVIDIFADAGNKCMVLSKKHGKYRWLADIYLSLDDDKNYSLNLNKHLVLKGLAEFKRY